MVFTLGQSGVVQPVPPNFIPTLGSGPSMLGRPWPPKGGKKKNLGYPHPALPPLPVFEANARGIPSYDSRVHGLMRLLGTPPTRSSRFPHPPPPSFSCLSSCPPVFLSLSLVFPLPPDRPAADRSKVISPWFVLDGATMVPAMALFSSWPCGLVRECCLAGRPWSSSSLPRISNPR